MRRWKSCIAAAISSKEMPSCLIPSTYRPSFLSPKDLLKKPGGKSWREADWCWQHLAGSPAGCYTLRLHCLWLPLYCSKVFGFDHLMNPKQEQILNSEVLLLHLYPWRDYNDELKMSSWKKTEALSKYSNLQWKLKMQFKNCLVIKVLISTIYKYNT